MSERTQIVEAICEQVLSGEGSSLDPMFVRIEESEQVGAESYDPRFDESFCDEQVSYYDELVNPIHYMDEVICDLLARIEEDWGCDQMCGLVCLEGDLTNKGFVSEEMDLLKQAVAPYKEQYQKEYA